jgi:hypothetical protein
MGFFKGIAGLFLYIGALFAPVGESRLEVKGLNSDDARYYRIKTTFDFQWNDNFTDIINSGIAITVKYSCAYDRKKEKLYRTLQKPVSQKEYLLIDSLSDGSVNTKKYANIPIAMRNFKQVIWKVESSAKILDFSAEVTNSFVPSMEIYVDISPLFGGRKFSKRLRIEKEFR